MGSKLRPEEYSTLLRQFRLDDHLSEQVEMSQSQSGDDRAVLARVYYRECLETLDELIKKVGIRELAQYLAGERRHDLFFCAIRDSPHLTRFIESNKPINIKEVDMGLREKVIWAFVIRVIELYDKGQL